MLEQLNTWVWGSGLLVLLLGTGLFLSIRTHFFRFLESVRFSGRHSADCSVGKTVQNNGKRVPQRWQLLWERETLSVLQQPFPLAEQGQFFDVGVCIFGHDVDLC